MTASDVVTMLEPVSAIGNETVDEDEEIFDPTVEFSGGLLETLGLGPIET